MAYRASIIPTDIDKSFIEMVLDRGYARAIFSDSRRADNMRFRIRNILHNLNIPGSFSIGDQIIVVTKGNELWAWLATRYGRKSNSTISNVIISDNECVVHAETKDQIELLLKSAVSNLDNVNLDETEALPRHLSRRQRKDLEAEIARMQALSKYYDSQLSLGKMTPEDYEHKQKVLDEFVTNLYKNLMEV